MPATDTEETFPKTVYEALHFRRKTIRDELGMTIRDELTPKAPSKKLEFSDIMVTMFGSQQPEFGVKFGFVYSHEFKQYFLFVESKSSLYQNPTYALMHIFLIIENELRWLNKANIIFTSPVFFPPEDNTKVKAWGCFRNELDEFVPKPFYYTSSGIFCDSEDFDRQDLEREHEPSTVKGLIESMDARWNAFVRDHSINTSD